MTADDQHFLHIVSDEKQAACIFCLTQSTLAWVVSTEVVNLDAFTVPIQAIFNK